MPKIGDNGQMRIMLRITGIWLLSGLVSLTVILKASAEFSGQARFVSNYVYHGYSKSNAEPAFQGNLDYEHTSGLFAGVWGSSVDFLSEEEQGHAHIEVSPYLGWHWQWGDDWRLDTAFTRYFYNGDHFGDPLDYNELYLMLHFRDLVSSRFSVALDAYGQGDESYNYEVQGRLPLSDTVGVSAVTGYEDADAAIEYDYLYWNIGATWFFHRNAAIDLRYHDSYLSDETLPGPGYMHLFEVPEIEHHIVVSFTLGF